MTPENNMQLVAACEKNPKRVEELKKKYDFNIYTDVDEMLQKEKELDFVVIVTTHESHEALTVKCLNAGKNVIVEEPMTMTYDSAMRMVGGGGKNKKHLFVHQSSAGSGILAAPGSDQVGKVRQSPADRIQGNFLR